ncbi:hypothetical protein BBO_02300 [Beauveria brongniartii RCEF 3172]|uniref:DRBM domain-containing protein n=1 Tax=Beauveria brongniartii RCEF 3172 TaxID=1081107 RepID=A0A167HKS6_9HYPO|nr:hypothetical protein BBO_02300 [Beauveria brongniartii RCEF 3172]
MTPASKACGLSPLLPVPWAGLRAWLDDAERTQALTGGATTHLAHAQLLALSQLVRFGGDEPPLPKEDHVSKLMRMSSSLSSSAVLATVVGGASRGGETPAAVAGTGPMEGVRFANGGDGGIEFVQAKQLEPPAFEMGEPVDVPVKGVFQLRWHCTCVLPWCNQTFPKREDGKPPALFSNKKDAKQYAAMLAVAYLNSATKEMATSHTLRKIPQETTQLPRQQASQMPPPQLPPSQPAPTQPPQQPHTESVPAQQQQQHTCQCASRQPQQQQPLILPTPVRPVTPTPTSLHGPVHVAASFLATPPSTNPLRAKRPLDSPTAPGSDNGSPTKQRHCSPAAAAALSPPPASASPPATDADAAAMVPPVSSAKGRRADAAAESSRLSAVLAKLCARLGASQPQYQITQNPDRPGFFSGFAKFSPGSRVPEDIAVVQDVLGKKQARILIDAQVLAWMEKEEARRQKLVEGML